MSNLSRPVRAIRGAITVPADEPGQIRTAVFELLTAIMDENDVAPADIISALFTSTPDLTSEFPAHAARMFGWTDIPLICAQELAVPGALPRCLRVMLHVETARQRGDRRDSTQASGTPMSRHPSVTQKDSASVRPKMV